MIIRFVFLFCLGLSLTAEASPSVSEFFKGQDEKALTVDFVVRRAIQKSSSFRLLGLEYQKAKLEVEKTQISQEWNLSGSLQMSDNAFETTSPFQPARTQGWNWNFGLNKFWTTGTRFSVGWDHSFKDLEYNLPPGFGGGFLDDFRQSVATVSLEQNLWKDAFGQASRGAKDAALAKTKSLQDNVLAQIESSTLTLIDGFYRAWFLQKSVQSLKDQQKRFQRLRRVTKRKLDRGSVETPEFYQVQALVASTDADYSGAKADLAEVWEGLILEMGLPKEYLSVDPMTVPTVLDDPSPAGLRACTGTAPESNSQLKSQEQALLSIKRSLEVAHSRNAPDLKLRAQYQGNGIDGGNQNVYRAVWQGDGPAWQVGLYLNWPLSGKQAKVEITELQIEKLKLEAQIEKSKDGLLSQWAEACRRLRLATATEKSFLQVVQKQKLRVRAEEVRFANGRISVDQLINAESDLGTWELKSLSQAVSTRGLAWKILKMSGGLLQKINPLLSQEFYEKVD